MSRQQHGIVAPHTFAMIMELFSAVSDAQRGCRRGEWSNAKEFTFYVAPHAYFWDGPSESSIRHIGQSAAAVALAFGMKVLVYSRRRKSRIIAESFRWTFSSNAATSSACTGYHDRNENAVIREHLAIRRRGPAGQLRRAALCST